MSAAIDDMYLYSSALKMEQKHRQEFRKRQHSESTDDESSSPKSASPSIDDDRRAHHNELERRRRDHIKDHFVILKDSIPLLEGEKSSRALILKRAVEYITAMQSRLNENQRSMDELRRKNELLEEKLRERESSNHTPTSALPSLTPPVQIAQPVQITLPVTIPQVSAIPQLPQIPQIPQTTNPLALSAMDPVHLNTLINCNQDAILALTQSLIGKMSASSPPGLCAESITPPVVYPTVYSPEQQQQPLAMQF